MKDIQYIRLTEENIIETNCCPEGLEVRGRNFKGDMKETLEWHKKMLEHGMTGFVSYRNGVARGFIEYMPAEVAPYPIEAPGSAVLMCYHYAPAGEDDEDKHLEEEKNLIELVLDDAKARFDGIAALGWEHEVHFPIDMLKDIGFIELKSEDHISLMWFPFDNGVKKPSLKSYDYEPTDLSVEGKLAVEMGYSNRCPYSLNHKVRLENLIDDLGYEDKIQLEMHQIDTKEQAERWSLSPWNWEWLFVNGEEVPIYEMDYEELKQFFIDNIEELED